MLGPDLATLQLLLALELGVMKTACVTECTGTVRSTAPLGRIDTVAAVAPSRWCSSASSLLHLHAVRLGAGFVVHGHVHLVHVCGLLSASTAGTGTTCTGAAGCRVAFADRVLDHVTEAFQHRLQPFCVADHFADFAVAWHAPWHRVRPMLFPCNAAEGLGKVVNRPRVASNPCQILGITP